VKKNKSSVDNRILKTTGNNLSFMSTVSPKERGLLVAFIVAEILQETLKGLSYYFH